MESSSTLLTSLNQTKSSTSSSSPMKKQKRKTTTTTTTKTTNKHIKVRYISNPMRVETCASKFRELVQELTGQDAADLPPEPTAFSAVDIHREEIDPTPLDEEIRKYYSPLDEEVFNGTQMSGFFSSEFSYNVNALGSIGSL
ncbi:unnamed protein product [Cochlearia groenlandica]